MNRRLIIISFLGAIGLLTLWSSRLFAQVIYQEQKPCYHRDRRISKHLLIAEDSLEEVLKRSNSSDYTWIGNHFLPPPNVPIFTVSQIRSYFHTRNVFLIGDSTNRRSYATLRGMINANNVEDISLNEIDGRSITEFSKQICEEDQQRALMTIENATDLWTCAGNDFFTCHDLENSSAQKYSASFSSFLSPTNNQTTSDSAGKKMFESKAHSRRGMFDQAHLCCYHEVTQRFQKDSDTLTAMRRDYDLVVIAMGLW
eukprot:CAMPEP_0198261002 /NCGR_PEP_ID=MMETSP1447-20131203/9820_1 /TAXON_ID=420782 /ORGANISM="Chaetoceros dichaeta, Strain CCMP1751" /LENGTH=255 /DNA_ID=CAMNT_0043948785 /DNA_START=113 /DNA_END=877 /DNA_ORIENTATION=+